MLAPRTPLCCSLILRTSRIPRTFRTAPFLLRPKLATMASQTPSLACCNTPPIVATGYQEKGKFITVNGMKTYTTGPTSASKGIFVIYDIFGFFPQTLQGADIISTSDKENQYQVFIPDFFDGKPADISWYPPDTEEKGQKLGEFFNTTAAPPKTLERIPGALQEIESNNPNIKEWAIVGYCWGGKIANLSATEGTKFKVAAALHPAMVDPEDAPKITIPTLLIRSEGEEKADVEKWQNAMKVKNQVTDFPDQVHGFMAARSDLENPKVKAAYEAGYQTLLTFLHEHMATSSPKL